jgi:hypothetical protein
MTIALLLALSLLQDAPKAFATTKEAMQKVQLVAGEWKGSGDPGESKDPAWTEKAEWSFKIDKDDHSLALAIEGGRTMKEGLLTYDLKKKVYRFSLTRPSGDQLAYEGSLNEKEKTLTLDQVVEGAADQERLEFHLLRPVNFFVNVERRRTGARDWESAYSIRYRKEGVPFVRGESPKCVVTGGLGSMPVTHKGETYYVCCSGCRTSFNAEPEKFLAEAKKQGWIK